MYPGDLIRPLTPGLILWNEPHRYRDQTGKLGQGSIALVVATTDPRHDGSNAWVLVVTRSCVTGWINEIFVVNDVVTV